MRDGGIMNITTRQFQLLSDVNLVWDFLTDIYDRETGSGVAAPFFEYALQSSWMNQSYSFLDRLWLDGDRVVAFVFYEEPVTDIYFSVRKGYEFLADELVNPEHSYLLQRALQRHGIPCRLEAGPSGGHGFADGTDMCMAGWIERAIRWYEDLSGTDPAAASN
jgi:hypothetical protein